MTKLKTYILKLLLPCFFMLIVLSGCKKKFHNHKMTFGVTIEYASYRYPGYQRGTFDVVKSKKQIDIAKELGVQLVRFDIRNEAINHLIEIKKLDTIINYARNLNLKILIGIYGMETWYNANFINFPYGGSGKVSWKQFKAMYIYQTFFLAHRYKPDYMIILPECPFNIGNQINSIISINQWVEFANSLSKTIKNASPKTQTIINEIPHVNAILDSAEYKFTAALMKNNSGYIDIIGCDSYNYDDLRTDVNNLLYLKNLFNWNGDLWITETNLIENAEIFTRPSTPQEDKRQKDFFIYAINLAYENGFKGFCIFNLTDDANEGSGGWGITYKNFSQKPAYIAIKQLIAQINGE